MEKLKITPFIDLTWNKSTVTQRKLTCIHILYKYVCIQISHANVNEKNKEKKIEFYMWCIVIV